uniref:Uncharacterized protein n=1 Tax=Pseudictyota dubia TaxID=2749911 RepID=A0A7R9WI11_9STRA
MLIGSGEGEASYQVARLLVFAFCPYDGEGTRKSILLPPFLGRLRQGKCNAGNETSYVFALLQGRKYILPPFRPVPFPTLPSCPSPRPILGLQLLRLYTLVPN